MIRKFIAGTTVVFATLGVATADEPKKPSPTPCPFVRTIDNFKAVDDYTAIIETGPSRKYLVKFANNCRELKWAWSARVESRPGICLRPGDIIVAGQQHGFVDRCYISSITQIAPNKPQTPASY
jgi:Family of unknown function (DUF6491)